MTFLSKFRRWWRERSFKAGYDWAVSELRLGNYDYVESWANDQFTPGHPFNEGVRKALDEHDWKARL